VLTHIATNDSVPSTFPIGLEVISNSLPWSGSMSRVLQTVTLESGIKLRTEVVNIDVKFTLNTSDGLRKVAFELKKETSDDGSVTWTITFQLFERAKKTDDFGDPLVDLEVDIQSSLNSKAETMANNGMTTKQAAYAIGPAADTAKDAEAGEIPEDKAKTAVQNTLKK
jgi:hypothetical protein